MKNLLKLAALSTLSAVLCAQETKVKPPPPDVQVEQKTVEGMQEEYDEATGEVINADGTVTRAAAVPALSSFAGFVVSTRPARLAPGQNGTLILVLSLQGEAVVLPGAGMALTYAPNQGPVSLGAWTVQPPKPGRLYRQFMDRPVHETFVQFEVPISIANNAVYNRYPVNLDLEIELVNGMSGASMGPKKGNVSHPVVVGSAMPTPLPLAAGSAGTPPPTGDQAAGPADVVSPGKGAQAGAAGVKPHAGAGAQGAANGPTPDTQSPLAEDFSGDPYQVPRGGDHFLLYMVLGAAVLGLVVLLLARGRR